ncbi:tetratricopeptide repeat protein [Marinicauda algicola]|uniref:Tetratricopeptide repeat protein n=1 Tax=Marinicauda algicola TaxID=2029849 RepID=A0A4S2GZT6_9PROT|nr:tetratricopeptide repeat protein [Marinicauda algicola]TGY88518.1 tetratricopeptide repeat protein [Marinicauda algicola]
MIRSRTSDPFNWIKAASALLMAGLIAMSVATDASAQRRNNNEEEEEIQRTLSAAVGGRILEVQELLDQEPPPLDQIIQILNSVLGMELTPYERSIALRMRGQVRFQQDNYSGAIQDFLAAIDTRALVPDEANSLRINIGQLYMVQDNVTEGIRQIELALQNGATLTNQIGKLLAQAYAQEERWREGLRYAEHYYNNTPAESMSFSDFSLVQAYYQSLERPDDELRVIRQMLTYYPDNRTAWQNLIALFARTGREEDAFEANKLMYLNGLLRCEDGSRLLNLAQYYSYYNNPYRGATLLERFINAGCVEESVRNLETLANMWRQAAEFDRAIPVLERIAEITGDGENALKLAEAHYQLNNFEAAERWFETALNRGGLDETGDAWVLLGTVRFERGNRQGALDAFERGTQYPGSRRAAQDWARFVRTQIQAEINRATRLQQVRIDECRLTLEQEVDLITLLGQPEDFNEYGQPIVDVPERCERWFNENAVQIRRPNMTDEEAAAFAEEQIRTARELAQQAQQRAG